MPHDSLLDLIGSAQDGSPLSRLFAEVNANAMMRVRDLLASTIPTGLPPSALAKELRAALGMPLARALTIARTETQRAYRETSRRTYLQSEDVLGGRKYEAYRDGHITLADLAKRTTDLRWGTMRTEATLEEAVERARRRRVRVEVQRQNRGEALARHERWVLERHPDRERAVFLDLAGRVVTRKEGERDQVLWTVEALRPLYGKVDLITHNHPDRGSIGRDDFTIMLALNAREVNAVTPQLRFRLVRTNDAWLDTIVGVFREEQKRLAEELGAALNAGRTTEEQVERVFYHELWQRMVRRFPDRLSYEVERRT